eukprot:Rmarinus@m.2048
MTSRDPSINMSGGLLGGIFSLTGLRKLSPKKTVPLHLIDSTNEVTEPQLHVIDDEDLVVVGCSFILPDLSRSVGKRMSESSSPACLSFVFSSQYLPLVLALEEVLNDWLVLLTKTFRAQTKAAARGYVQAAMHRRKQRQHGHASSRVLMMDREKPGDRYSAGTTSTASSPSILEDSLMPDVSVAGGLRTNSTESAFSAGLRTCSTGSDFSVGLRASPHDTDVGSTTRSLSKAPSSSSAGDLNTSSAFLSGEDASLFEGITSALSSSRRLRRYRSNSEDSRTLSPKASPRNPMDPEPISSASPSPCSSHVRVDMGNDAGLVSTAAALSDGLSPDHGFHATVDAPALAKVDAGGTKGSEPSTADPTLPVLSLLSAEDSREQSSALNPSSSVDLPTKSSRHPGDMQATLVGKGRGGRSPSLESKDGVDAMWSVFDEPRAHVPQDFVRRVSHDSVPDSSDDSEGGSPSTTLHRRQRSSSCPSPDSPHRARRNPSSLRRTTSIASEMGSSVGEGPRGDFVGSAALSPPARLESWANEALIHFTAVLSRFIADVEDVGRPFFPEVSTFAYSLFACQRGTQSAEKSGESSLSSWLGGGLWTPEAPPSPKVQRRATKSATTIIVSGASDASQDVSVYGGSAVEPGGGKPESGSYLEFDAAKDGLFPEHHSAMPTSPPRHSLTEKVTTNTPESAHLPFSMWGPQTRTPPPAKVSPVEFDLLARALTSYLGTGRAVVTGGSADGVRMARWVYTLAALAPPHCIHATRLPVLHDTGSPSLPHARRLLPSQFFRTTFNPALTLQAVPLSAISQTDDSRWILASGPLTVINLKALTVLECKFHTYSLQKQDFTRAFVREKAEAAFDASFAMAAEQQATRVSMEADRTPFFCTPPSSALTPAPPMSAPGMLSAHTNPFPPLPDATLQQPPPRPSPQTSADATHPNSLPHTHLPTSKPFVPGLPAVSGDPAEAVLVKTASDNDAFSPESSGSPGTSHHTDQSPGAIDSTTVSPDAGGGLFVQSVSPSTDAEPTNISGPTQASSSNVAQSSRSPPRHSPCTSPPRARGSSAAGISQDHTHQHQHQHPLAGTQHLSTLPLPRDPRDVPADPVAPAPSSEDNPDRCFSTSSTEASLAVRRHSSAPIGPCDSRPPVVPPPTQLTPSQPPTQPTPAQSTPSQSPTQTSIQPHTKATLIQPPPSQPTPAQSTPSQPPIQPAVQTSALPPAQPDLEANPSPSPSPPPIPAPSQRHSSLTESLSRSSLFGRSSTSTTRKSRVSTSSATASKGARHKGWRAYSNLFRPVRKEAPLVLQLLTEVLGIPAPLRAAHLSAGLRYLRQRALLVVHCVSASVGPLEGYAPPTSCTNTPPRTKTSEESQAGSSESSGSAHKVSGSESIPKDKPNLPSLTEDERKQLRAAVAPEEADFAMLLAMADAMCPGVARVVKGDPAVIGEKVLDMI